MTYTVDVLYNGFPAMLGLGAMALIRDGRHNILFDTGNGVMRPQMKKIFSDHDLKFGDIDTIILSHIHWDHTFNIDLFPGAEYIISKTEWDNSCDESYFDLFANIAAVPFLKKVKLRTIENDGEEILPGMTAIFTPGHTPGCMSILLDQGDEKWILTGDSIKTRGELRTETSSMTYDPAVTKGTIQKIKKLATRILPGHDGWISIRNDEIIPESNQLVLSFSEGMTANGGQSIITISLD